MLQLFKVFKLYTKSRFLLILVLTYKEMYMLLVLVPLSNFVVLIMDYLFFFFFFGLHGCLHLSVHINMRSAYCLENVQAVLEFLLHVLQHLFSRCSQSTPAVLAYKVSPSRKKEHFVFSIALKK